MARCVAYDGLAPCTVFRTPNAVLTHTWRLVLDRFRESAAKLSRLGAYTRTAKSPTDAPNLSHYQTTRLDPDTGRQSTRHQTAPRIFAYAQSGRKFLDGPSDRLPDCPRPGRGDHRPPDEEAAR